MDTNKRTLKLFDQAKDVATYRQTLCGYNFEPVRDNFVDRYRDIFKPKSGALDSGTLSAQLTSNMVIVDKFTESACQDLLRKYPNVDDLTLFYGIIRTPALTVLLSSQWASNLKSLFFYPPNIPLNPFYPPYKIDWPLVWPQLARMPQLKSLYLFHVSGLVDLSGMPLEQLGLCDYETGDLYEALVKCGPNLKRLVLSHTSRSTSLVYALQEINSIQKSRKVTQLFNGGDYSKIAFSSDTQLQQIMSKVDYTANVLTRLVKVKPQLKSSLTHLTMDCDSFGIMCCSLGLVRLVCEQFQELRHLSVSLKHEIKLFDLLPFLARLPHLTELGLSNTNTWNQTFFANLATAQALPSVRYLHLFATINLPEFTALPTIFPSLRQLEFDMSFLKCTTSGDVHLALDHLPHCSACRRQLVDILNRFADLPKLEFIPGGTEKPGNAGTAFEKNRAGLSGNDPQDSGEEWPRFIYDSLYRHIG